ncbi:MAG: SDR family oxidoreductase [Planctomycetota bacterium]
MTKHYLIIGGSHGIGGELTRRLLTGDNHLTVISRTVGELDPAQPQVTHVTADVTQEIPADAFPESIDGLAYCPGSISLSPIRGLSPEVLTNDFQLNVVGAVRCIQAALKGLKASGAGSIVLFSTVAVSQGMPMHSSVAAVKGAIEGLARTLAAELAPSIRVNVVAPALVDTPLAARFLGDEKKRAAMDKRHPLGRVGTAPDIAAAAEYLLSNQSGWVSGQVLGVDGGLSTLRT